MRILRQSALWMIAGVVSVSCKERVQPAAPSEVHEVQRTKLDFQYAGFVVRDGDVPQAKMLRFLAAELRGEGAATKQDLRDVDELIVLCDETEQDSTVKADALKKWNALRPKIELALGMAGLRAYDDPANDADAQGKELKTGTNK